VEREIIHIDIAAFAVAVERVVHPELRRRPVVVAPVGPSRSIVTALSPEAQQAGIRKGMILARALRRCRDLVVLPPNEPLYARASRALSRVLEGFSPVLEPAGYGQAYLDMTGTGRIFGPPRDAAWRAQKEIRQQLHLDASLGVASNKMVSRIAAVLTEPAGLQDVPTGDESAFLAPLPAPLLPGVGPKTEEQLRELNIRIIRELATMKREHLMLAFGRLGFVLHQRAQGIDDTPVYPPRAVPAAEEEIILAEDSNDWDLLKGALVGLCERAGERLQAQKQRAGRMELRVRHSDYREAAGGAKLVPPLQSTSGLAARAGRMLEHILTRRTRVRSLHLRLTELSSGPAQLDLFADPATQRNARLESALDTLRHRYGAASWTVMSCRAASHQGRDESSPALQCRDYRVPPPGVP
jgi:DNA polymerase-4